MIKTIIGKLDSTRIPTSSCCNSEKKIILICFFSLNILPQGLIALLTKFDKKYLTVILTTPVIFSAKIWGYGWEVTGFFGSIVPLALLINP